MAGDNKLMGVADVAVVLGLTEADVRQWARADGDVSRIGTTWVFRAEDVARLEEDLDDCYDANPDEQGDDEDDDDDIDDEGEDGWDEEGDDDDSDDDDQDDDDQDDDDQDDGDDSE